MNVDDVLRDGVTGTICARDDSSLPVTPVSPAATSPVLTGSSECPYWILKLMAEEEAQKPLKERIEEKIRGWIDDLAEAIEGLVAPAPEPIPIPIKRP